MLFDNCSFLESRGYDFYDRAAQTFFFNADGNLSFDVENSRDCRDSGFLVCDDGTALSGEGI